jgi:hypothetical protein
MLEASVVPDDFQLVGDTSPMPKGPDPVALCGDVERQGWRERQHTDVRFLPAKCDRIRTHLVSASVRMGINPQGGEGDKHHASDM